MATNPIRVRIGLVASTGTIGGIYRSVLYAINANPFMAAIVKRDSHILGNYLLKPNNMLVNLQSPSMWKNFLLAMQKAGAIRQEVNLEVMEYVVVLQNRGWSDRVA